jgi:hypothetical protein
MKRACKVAQLSASMPSLLNPQDTDRPPLQAVVLRRYLIRPVSRSPGIHGAASRIGIGRGRTASFLPHHWTGGSCIRRFGRCSRGGVGTSTGAYSPGVPATSSSQQLETTRSSPRFRRRDDLARGLAPRKLCACLAHTQGLCRGHRAVGSSHC